MRKLTNIFTALILTSLLTSYTLLDNSVKLFDIPSQTIDLFKILGVNSKGKDHTIKGCQISRLVTYKDYKEYLDTIKKDSSESYYQTQLPDRLDDVR